MAVLPLLRRRWLDATCLVFGAMAPDFEYFVRGQEQGNFGHSLIGMWVWGLPATLVLAALFHGPVKRLLWEVAPRPIARRTAEAAARPWPGRWSAAVIVSLVVSAVIGNATHLLWDTFTHANGWGAHRFPHLLEHRVHVPVVGKMRRCRILQYVSSIFGLVVVAWYAVRALRRAPAVEVAPAPHGARLVLAACMLAGMALVTARAVWLLHARDPGSVVVAVIAGMLAGILAASVIVKPRRSVAAA